MKEIKWVNIFNKTLYEKCLDKFGDYMGDERLVPKLRFSGFDDSFNDNSWINYFIKDACDVITGFPFKSEYYSEKGKYKVLRGDNVKSGFIKWDEKTKCWNEFTDKLERYLLKENDIIIGMDGSKVGRNQAIILKKDLPSLLAQRVACIRSNNNFYQEYLKQIFFSDKFTRYVDAVKTGTSIYHISKKQIENFKFTAPPIEEQKKIAKFLLNIDNKIGLLEKKHKSYQDFKKYLMQQIFTQKLRFADCTDEWKVCKFKDLGTVKSGVGFSNKYQGHLDLDYNVYKVSDMNLKGNEKVMTKSNNTIDDNILNDMGVKLIREPSIIFAKVGEAIFLNRKRIAKPHFLIDNNMMAFSPNNNVDLEFMYYLTTSINFGKYAQTGALPSYNASDIYSIKCKIPPLEEQKRIGNLLSLADNKINNCSNQINNVLNFKRGLLQQMFV